MKLQTLKPRLSEPKSRISSPGSSRITGRRRQAIRVNHLTRHPLCTRCEEKGFVRAATEVDHIIPLHKGGAEAEDNRQGLCRDCHLEKTREDLKP